MECQLQAEYKLVLMFLKKVKQIYAMLISLCYESWQLRILYNTKHCDEMLQ